MDTPFMAFAAESLAAAGFEVVRFEFPYMNRRRQHGRRGPPDRMPVLEATMRDVAAEVGGPVILGGKSMGARVATRLADELKASAAFAFGYPFHPPKKPSTLRTAHLQALQTPTLIVQGDRDPFGTPDEVSGYALSPSIRVHWLPDGDHSFKPRKASGYSEREHWQTALDRLVEFLTVTLR